MEDTCRAELTPEDCHPITAGGQNYPIQIAYAQNGYICVVGCMTVVFEKKAKMLAEISRYLENPKKVEKEYQSKKRS